MPLDALVSGRIATFAGETGFGWVEAIGIRDGRIAFAGSAVELESRADPLTRRFELDPGEIAIPALTDAHLHLADAALAADQVDLSAAATLEDGLALVAEAAARHPPDAWLEGAGWDERRWGRWPRGADLEAAAPGRRVALWSYDHHSIWASPAALAAAGVGAATADPPGGVIRRDDDGRPEGVLFEAACGLVTSLIGPPDEATLERGIVALGDELLSLGVVGVHDPGSLSADPELRGLERLAHVSERDALRLRVHASVRSDGLETAIERDLQSGGPLGADPRARIRLGWLKLFADGTLGSRTAALLEPIEPDAAGEGIDPRGVFRLPPTELADWVARGATGRIASQVHAIGDAAVRAALNALAPSAAAVPLMPRVEHVQLCHPDDRARFADLGVAASVQPVHLRADAAKARRDWGSRAEVRGYAWRSLLEAGAVVAFGTDAPVEPVDPWPGIALAVLRRDPSWGEDDTPFGPHESLPLEAALRAACVGPYATVRDPLGGRLVPGSPADLIVLPAEPAGADDNGGVGLARVRPRLVLVAGEAVVDR
ncbi:MAG TPA: amidohydrolase [Candidatus Deferrimicrobiaceae bacterium]|nr:amidohydrolase [Candidatus Deferrimicrobiaceae bacterium]